MDLNELGEYQTRSTITLAREDQLGRDSKYDPFAHRNVTHPTSTVGSFFHLLKSSLGSGLLAMPAAFKHIGIIPGVFGTALVALIATHCVHILVSTSRALCEESRVASLSYAETCEKAFKHGPKMIRRFSTHIRHFADFAMAGVCLGGTSVYVIFIASSLKDICDHFYPSHVYSIKTYCGFLLLPLILTSQIRHLKFLVPFSLLANICLLLTFLITCYYTFQGIPSVGPEKLAAGVTRWPLFLSTAIFAMEGINVVMPIENEMANPKRFLGCPGVLNVTMVFVATLYGVVGLFGFLKYGDEAQGSITLNLPQDEILAMVAKILVAVAVFFTYCLQMYAPLDILWIRVQSFISVNYHNLGQIVLRTLCVVLTVTLAIAVPDLELLIGLVGAIFFSTLGLLIPVVVQTAHCWDRNLGPYLLVVWKNMLLLLFYLLVLVSGCYVSIGELVAKFS